MQASTSGPEQTTSNRKQKITPFLWFDGDAEEAVNFYVSIFNDSKIISMPRRSDGEVISATFELEGQTFMALNGGPQYKFNPAISLFVSCETQAEVDSLWARLGAGGQPSRCGWLKDKFGLSWQIVPTILDELLHDTDREKVGRVMQAMLQMEKIDIQGLQQAYDGLQQAYEGAALQPSIARQHSGR